MKGNLFAIIIAAIMLFVGSSCSDRDANNSGRNASEVTVNVDVILPEDLKREYTDVIAMALKNLTLAQQNLDNKVKLNLRYHDEDTENIDQLAKQLTTSSDGDTCHAVIGPFRDDDARIFLGYTAKTNIPVILPTCVDPELQRIYSRCKNTWFLTESTTTQLEVMLQSISQVSQYACTALLYSTDKTGISFKDYFGRFATEFKLEVRPGTICPYKQIDDAEFQSFWKEIEKQPHTRVCLALTNESDLRAALDTLSHIRHLYSPFIAISGNNVGMQHYLDNPANVIVPLCSPMSGFLTEYNAQIGEYPIFGQAQIYDALSIIALGAAKRLGAKDPAMLYVMGEKVDCEVGKGTPSLNDWMRAVVDDDCGDETNWTAEGLNVAFRNFSEGGNCIVSGATGTLDFDDKIGTQLLHTYYGWLYFDGKFLSPSIVAYLSTSTQERGGAYVSTTQTWRWELFVNQEFNKTVAYQANLPNCTDNWALLITPSTTWENYRHQSDVFSMYQLLRKKGYSADHIITISEDNLAESSQNAGYEGKIFMEKNGEDMRSGCKVDYHFSDLTREDVADIMLGKSSTHLPKVLNTTSSSDIFVFWSGHGGSKDGPLWGNDNAKYSFGSDRMRQIVSQMKEEGKYRRMMMAVETCYSGIWGEALEGIKDLVVLTSANDIESSFADGYDDDRHLYYRNAFTKTFYDELSKSTAGEFTLRELYLKLAKTTTNSHVRLYNEQNYGSVYTAYMYDFLPGYW